MALSSKLNICKIVNRNILLTINFISTEIKVVAVSEPLKALLFWEILKSIVPEVLGSY